MSNTNDQKIAEIEEKIYLLQSQLKILKNNYPAVHDFYYYIDSTCSVKNWNWCISDNDIKRFEIGNFFLNLESAQIEAAKRKLEFEIKNFIKQENGDWRPNWDDKDQPKYMFALSGRLTVSNAYTWICPSTLINRSCVAKSPKIILNAIDKFGHDKILKLLRDEDVR